MVARPFWSHAVSPISLPAALKTAALSLGLLLQVPAQAGLITGSWDPEFGSALPGLSWSAYAELTASDACTAAVGNQTVGTGTGGPCADAKVNAVFLQLYNTPFGALDWSDSASYGSTPPNSATFAVCDTSVSGIQSYIDRCNDNFGDYFNLSALRIEGGSVAGLKSSVGALFAAVDYEPPFDLLSFLVWPSLESPASRRLLRAPSLPSSANKNLFSLNFTVNGPELWCELCNRSLRRVQSETDGLRQFLVTYESDDTSKPKFTDSTGKALGVVLDENGKVLGRSTSINGQLVPEPAGLALVLTALGAAALVRRRR